MPKSSKAVGTKKKILNTISIDDQVLAKEKEIEKKLAIHFGLNKIKYLLREQIEIERLVTNAIPIASYDLKEEIISQSLGINSTTTLQEKLPSFQMKVSEFLEEHPPIPQDSVESYILKHQHYLPTEFIFLMRQKGKIEIQDASLEEIEDSLYGILKIDNQLDDFINSECRKQNIDSARLSIERNRISPKIQWLGRYTHFAGFIQSMIKNGWIKEPSSVIDESSRQYIYNFEILLKDKEVDPRTLSKSLSKFKKEILSLPEINQKRLDKREYPFVPVDFTVKS